jgi:hypothetical protein
MGAQGAEIYRVDLLKPEIYRVDPEFGSALRLL